MFHYQTNTHDADTLHQRLPRGTNLGAVDQLVGEAREEMSKPRRLAMMTLDFPPAASLDHVSVDADERVVSLVFESPAYDLVKPGEFIPRIPGPIAEPGSHCTSPWVDEHGNPTIPTPDQLAAEAKLLVEREKNDLRDEFQRTFTGAAAVATLKVRSMVREHVIGGLCAAAGGIVGTLLTQLGRALYARLIGN